MGKLICIITGCGQVPCNSHEVSSGEGNSSTAFWILPSLCLVEDLESKGPHFPNVLGHRIFFFFSFLQSIVFLLTLSGSPTPVPSSAAAVSLIKWDRHQWHLLLPLHQVNLCFDQFVYKLADQIFAYYKAMAGRYESSALWCQTFLRLPPGRQGPVSQNLPSALAPKEIWMIPDWESLGITQSGLGASKKKKEKQADMGLDLTELTV